MKALFTALCLCAVASGSAVADSFIYGNNATGSSPYVYKINKTTGAIVDTYTNLSSDNGRGVVVVGNTMYYTAATSGSVYTYDLSTHTNNGALFNVAGASALSTVAYDGKDLIIGDYSGTNKVYFYSTTGSLLNTVSLKNCTGDCDGLEYYENGGKGYLVENEGDADDPYDLYGLDGTLIKAGFIKPANNLNTGIAFDGTDFFTSDIYQGLLNEYDANGTFLKSITLTGAPSGYSPLIEDLSADYNQVLPPPTNVTPEPSSLLLFGSGVLGIAGVLRRRMMPHSRNRT